MNYISVDIEPHASVDIVVKPGEKLPFETGSIDLIVSTSCFEHDPCFWITFKEMCRITRLNGLIYVNAPGNGEYHKYPGDNWRFYPDSGQALAYWSSRQISDETVYSVKVKETFYIYPKGDKWKDFICVWKRTLRRQSKITVSEDVKKKIGPLKRKLISNGFDIRNKIHTR
jgi:SAM-dependent methyltransferase